MSSASIARRTSSCRSVKESFGIASRISFKLTASRYQIRPALPARLPASSATPGKHFSFQILSFSVFTNDRPFPAPIRHPRARHPRDVISAFESPAVRFASRYGSVSRMSEHLRASLPSRRRHYADGISKRGLSKPRIHRKNTTACARSRKQRFAFRLMFDHAKRKLGQSNLEVSAIGQAGKGRGMKEAVTDAKQRPGFPLRSGEFLTLLLASGW